MTGGEVPGTLRPSGAPIRAHCAGSFVMQQLYPEAEDSPAAREGTAAHFYATEAVLGRVHVVGTLAPNGHPIDAAMVEGGNAFVNDIAECQTALASVTPPGSPPWAFGVETKLTMHARIHPDCEGTPDAYLLDMAAGKAGALYVWDYKYGHGYVDPFRNEQLLEYCAGVFEAYELTDGDVAGLSVSIRIVQPRNYDEAGPVRRWDTTGAEVLRLIAWLREREHAAKQPNAPTTTGEHCRYCTANAHCRAAQAVAMDQVDRSSSSIPRELPPVALGLYVRTLEAAQERLTHHLDAAKEVLEATVRSGAQGTGWAIGTGRGKEVWTIDPDALFAIGSAMGVELRKRAEPITPKQARDAGLDASVTQAYATQQSGKARLVPSDVNTAARIFGG